MLHFVQNVVQKLICPHYPFPLVTNQNNRFLHSVLDKTNPVFSIHVLRSCGFCRARAETIGESYKEGRGGDDERQGESFGTDFTNKCRRLNPGMSQDGSLSLNHRLPAASAFHLASHRIVPSYHRDVHRPLLRFALPADPLRPSQRRFHLRERFPSSRQLGNLPHAYAAATLSLSLPHPVVTRHLESYVNDGQVDWNRKMSRN